MLGYNNDIKPWGYDPEKAKSLLNEAGVEEINATFTRNGSSPTMPNPALADK